MRKLVTLFFVIGLFMSASAWAGIPAYLTRSDYSQYSEDFEKNAQKHKNLTLTDAYDCINVIDDDLETEIRYNTFSCINNLHAYARVSHHPLKNDIFIRAFKNKATGNADYQIYIVIHTGKWTDPYGLNYKFGDRVASSRAISIDTDVDCSSSPCDHTEDIGFSIPEDYLADLSDRYDEIKGTGITMRLKMNKLSDEDFLFNPAELVGLYRTVKGIK